MHATEFDSLTVEQLRTVVGRKWSTFEDCIGAFVAEADFGTAPPIKRALREVVDAGFFGYLPEAHKQEMLDATADWYRNEYGWNVPVERIHPLPDVIKGLEAALVDFSKPGSKVIVPTPAYMPFVKLPALFGREHVEVPSLMQNGRLELDYDAIDAAFADGGGLLILCNPQNPTGRVYDRDELLRVSEIVERHGGRVFSDEIHAPLVYPGKTHTPYASVSDAAASHTITATSASKAWNLAGLKTAQIILSSDADAKHWNESPAGFMYEHGASVIGVIANAVAYREGKPWLTDVIDYLDGNRKLLGELLSQLMPEAVYHAPEGTYLAWIDLNAYDLPSDVDLFYRTRAKVALVNGDACGNVGEGHARFNFAMSRSMLEQAVTQMAAATKEI
jgi:cystathionine beta-lyase